MAILEVKDICKKYPGFELKNVSFDLEEGSIMGFIGRNGAGKTTTLKAVINLVHPDSGSVKFFGMDFKDNEKEIKQHIGYAGGTVDFYKKKSIAKIAAVTSTFYDEWDEDAYRHYLKLFSLDENKTPAELSEGMKVKFSLLLALSHKARCLILDEPTSGLDPVSRAEIMEIFKYLKSKGTSVLFSTHITSDIEGCADHITYIRNGQIAAWGRLDEYIRECKNKGLGDNLQDIMVHYEKEAFYEKIAE